MAEGGRRRGVCKWFNIVKGYGFITPHDGSPDVFLHQTAIQMEGFRSLAEGEEVEYEVVSGEWGAEASLVCGPGGVDCKGSDRKPVSKKRSKKVRCYNCGLFSTHIAAKCPKGPLPKRCHACGSGEHLIAECPQRDSETGRVEEDVEMAGSDVVMKSVDEEASERTITESATAGETSRSSGKGASVAKSKNISDKSIKKDPKDPKPSTSRSKG